MSKKRYKKPKPKQVAILSASEMRDYIRLKFETENDKFWDWFFSESQWGETNILSLTDEDEIIQPEFMNYFNIIIKDFSPDADEEDCIEIENDL